MSGTIRIDLRNPKVDVQIPATGVRVGFPGPQGPPGEGLDIKGTLPDGNPPVDPGTDPGDAWIDPTGGFWVWDGTQWSHVSGGGGLDQATADGLYVNVAGDSMQGALILPGDPQQPFEAATKQYVDDAVAGGGGTGDYVPITGGTMTGPLWVQDGAAGWPRVEVEGGRIALNGTTASGILTTDPEGHMVLAGSEGIVFTRSSVSGEPGVEVSFLAPGSTNFAVLRFTDPATGIVRPEVALKGEDVWRPVAYLEDIPAGGGGGDGLPLTGGTLTGPLTITTDYPNKPLVLVHTASGKKVSIDPHDQGNLAFHTDSGGVFFTRATAGDVSIRMQSAAGVSAQVSPTVADGQMRLNICSTADWVMRQTAFVQDIAPLQAEIETLKGKLAMVMELMGLGEGG